MEEDMNKAAIAEAFRWILRKWLDGPQYAQLTGEHY